MSALPTRPLGRSGIDVSIVGLGCNNFGRRVDLDATRAVVDAALEEGITFFDTADIYGRGQSEEYLGEVLQGRRDQVVLATKFGMDMGDGRGPRGSRAYVHNAIDASLKRLRTDTIDYYWYHEPDGVTPILETLEALHELVQAGKVRAIGASNFDGRPARGGRRPRRGARPHAVHGRAERVQPARPRGRGGRSCPPASAWASASSRSSRSPPACSPASTAAASRDRPEPACPAGTRSPVRSSSTSSRRSSGGRTSAACP